MITDVQEQQHIDEVAKIKKSYLFFAFWCTVVVLIGLRIAFIINENYPLRGMTIDVLQVLSLVPGAASLFVEQNWDIQTWGGKSPAELLNKKLFMYFSFASLLLPAVAFSLHTETIDELSPQMRNEIFMNLKMEILEELAKERQGKLDRAP